MENIKPFGFIADPTEINLKSFNNLYFAPYHKPVCHISNPKPIPVFSLWS